MSDDKRTFRRRKNVGLAHIGKQKINRQKKNYNATIADISHEELFGVEKDGSVKIQPFSIEDYNYLLPILRDGDFLRSLSEADQAILANTFETLIANSHYIGGSGTLKNIDDSFKDNKIGENFGLMIEDIKNARVKNYDTVEMGTNEFLYWKPDLETTLNFNEHLHLAHALDTKIGDILDNGGYVDKLLEQASERYLLGMSKIGEQLIDQELIKTRLFNKSFNESLENPLEKINGTLGVLSSKTLDIKEQEKFRKDIRNELNKIYSLKDANHHPYDIMKYASGGRGELTSPAFTSQGTASLKANYRKLTDDDTSINDIKSKLTELLTSRDLLINLEKINKADYSDFRDEIDNLIKLASTPSLLMGSPVSLNDLIAKRDAETRVLKPHKLKTERTNAKLNKSLEKINHTHELGVNSAVLTSLISEELSNKYLKDQDQKIIDTWIPDRLSVDVTSTETWGLTRLTKEYYKMIDAELKNNSRAYRRVTFGNDLAIGHISGKTGIINARLTGNYKEGLSSDTLNASKSIDALISRLGVSQSGVDTLSKLRNILDAEGFNSDALLKDYIIGRAELVDSKNASLTSVYSTKDTDLNSLMVELNKMRSQWARLITMDQGSVGSAEIMDINDFKWDLLNLTIDDAAETFLNPSSVIDINSKTADIIELAKTIGVVEVEDSWQDKITKTYSKLKINGKIVSSTDPDFKAALSRAILIENLTEVQFVSLLKKKAEDWTTSDLVKLGLWLDIDMTRSGGERRDRKISNYYNAETEAIYSQSKATTDAQTMQKIIDLTTTNGRFIDDALKSTSEFVINKEILPFDRLNKLENTVPQILDNLKKNMALIAKNPDLDKNYLLQGELSDLVDNIRLGPSGAIVPLLDYQVKADLIATIEGKVDLDLDQKKLEKEKINKIFSKNNLSHFKETTLQGGTNKDKNPDFKTEVNNMQQRFEQGRTLELLATYIDSSTMTRSLPLVIKAKNINSFSDDKKTIKNFKTDPRLSNAIEAISEEMKKSRPDRAIVKNSLNIIESRKSKSTIFQENVVASDHIKNLALVRSLAGKNASNLSTAENDRLKKIAKDYDLGIGQSLTKSGNVKSYTAIAQILDFNQIKVVSGASVDVNFDKTMKDLIVPILVANYDLKQELKTDSLLKSKTAVSKKKTGFGKLKQFDDPFEVNDDLFDNLFSADEDSDLFSNLGDNALDDLFADYKASEEDINAQPQLKPIKRKVNTKTSKKPMKNTSKTNSSNWITSGEKSISPQIIAVSANMGRSLTDLSTRMDGQETHGHETHLVGELSVIADEMNTIRKELKGVSERVMRVKGKRARRLLERQKQILTDSEPGKIVTKDELDSMLENTTNEIEKLNQLLS